MAEPTRGRIAYLYEDDVLVAVDKPAGLAVISPEGSRSKSLYDIVTDHIRKKNPKGRAALVHRIDRDTSGIVLFAKDGRAKKALMERWDEMVSERRYVAVVEGAMEADRGRFESYLAENSGGEVYVCEAGKRGAKLAVTDYRVLKTDGRRSLLELKLETGRKHQIRVQLAASGHPVLGDPKYGAKGRRPAPHTSVLRSRDPEPRLYLHAAGMAFRHPRDRRSIVIDSPPPRFFFTIFKPDNALHTEPGPKDNR